MITRTGAIPTWDLTDRLAKARTHAGLGQDELASELGLSRQSVSNYERGYAKPKRPVVWAWADITGVDRHWLAWGEPPPDDEQPDDEQAPAPGLEPGTNRITAGRSAPGIPTAELHRFRKHFTVPVAAADELTTIRGM